MRPPLELKPRNTGVSKPRQKHPGAWAALVAWLVSLGLPAAVTDWLSGLGGRVTELVALAVVYVAVRYVEPHLPSWLARVLLGSPTPPTYAPAVDGPQQVTTQPPAPTPPVAPVPPAA